MIEFHPGTQIAKSRFNAFDIPPKSQPRDRHPKKSSKPALSKAQQAAQVLETSKERAARWVAEAIAFKAGSQGTFPSASPDMKASATAKVARLKGKPL